MFFYKENILRGENINLLELAKRKTPVYVYSKNLLLENIKNFKKKFKDALICFAYKANSNIHLLRLIAQEGLGADAASYFELETAFEAGVEPLKIVLNGNAKQKDEILKAIYEGILAVNVDSLQELKFLDYLTNQEKKNLSVAMRVNPNIDPKTHPKVATGLRESKFGTPEEEVIDAYNFIKNTKYLKAVGIHTHIGSQITTPQPFKEASEKLSRLFSKITNELGIELKYINMGGGWGVDYEKGKVLDLELYKNAIVEGLPKDANLILEPGRAIIANCAILITKVLYIKKTKDRNIVVLDCAMNDFMRVALYSAYHRILPLVKDGKGKIYDVVGGICEESDVFAKQRYIEADLKEGDYLAIMDTGAYGYSMVSNYNLRPKPPEILIDNDQLMWIRNSIHPL